MTRRENLLIVASEECAEVSKAISKLMRFGAENHHPDSSETNEYKLMVEYYQLVATMDMLINTGTVHNLPSEEVEKIKHEKMVNVLKYQKVSKELGTIK